VLIAVVLLPLLFPGVAESRAQAVDAGPVVHVDGGSIHGELHGQTAVFRGIPFAAPPVGALRWREPLPVTPWAGVRDATRSASACVQSSAGLDPFVAPLAEVYGVPYTKRPVSSSEDCLYLNVWAPQWPLRDSAPRPVMVWLHGGSNTAGSGSQTTYDGTSLAAHGVIVITINYRLGVMGFFSHSELTRESAHHSSGNYGLLDQLAALRWVRQNISQFGGDPGNVTLFGESAGSIDAGMLMVSPLSAGLFRRVILESGPPFGLGSPHTLQETQPAGAAIAKAAPGNTGSALGNLRAMPAEEVVKLAASVLKSQFQGFDPNSPIVDGWILPEPAVKAIASGRAQKVDVMIGLNGRELSAFRIDAAAAAKLTSQQEKSGGAGDALKKLEDAARPIYGSWVTPAVGLYLAKAILDRAGAIDQASNDMLMACPIGAASSLIAAAGQKVFVYKFDRSIPGKGESDLGAFHGLEIPYVFNTFNDPGWNWLPFSATDHALSDVMETYWTNFAKAGNPNSSGVPAWGAWSTDDEPYMEFSKGAEAVPRTQFSPTFCHLAPARLKERLAAN
jgi:para-nitrobenzyl esterase